MTQSMRAEWTKLRTLTGTAWLLSLIVFQTGRALGF